MGGKASKFLSTPWRTLPSDKEETMTFVKSYRPQNKDVQAIRILLHGPVGAGKSSFINSVESVLQGRVTDRAPTDAITSKSYTQQYRAYKIHKDPENYYPFIFNDIMGLEKDNKCGVAIEDVILALEGHMKDKYMLDPINPLKSNDPSYNPNPTLEDQVHALVTVIPASTLSLLSAEVLNKMREVRVTASDLGIPQLVVITKIDEADPDVDKNMGNVHKSIYLKGLVDKLHCSLGIQENRIFLVRNYNSEMTTNDGMDALILMALKQMLWSAEDSLNNL